MEAVPPAPGSPVAGPVRLEFGDMEITASAAITVDSTSIVYTGYTNSSGNFVGAVRNFVHYLINYMMVNAHFIFSNPVLRHCNLIFTFPWELILHKNDVISSEAAAVGEWTGLHICGYRIVCKRFLFIFARHFLHTICYNVGSPNPSGGLR